METGKIIKTFQSKKGHEVMIRYPKWEDVDALTEYINELSKEDTFIRVHHEVMTKEDEMRYLADNFCKMEKGNMIQLFAFVDGVFAANCSIERGTRRMTHVGTVAIAIRKAYREEGIGTVLLETLIAEAKKLPFELLTLTCYEENIRALHVYEKVGFQKGGMIPGAVDFHGKKQGEVFMYLPLKINKGV